MGLAAGDIVINLIGNSSQLSTSLNSARGMVRGFAREITGMLGTLGGAGAAGFSLTAIVQEASEAARSQKRLEAVLRATGDAAGWSGAEMADYADSLQDLTGIDGDSIKDAMATLATFGNVSGKQFKDAIRLAADLAAVFETDVKTATMQLGRALASPTEGLSALRRAGVVFSDAEKDKIKTLEESGRLMEAQQFILDALANKVGGTAAAIKGHWAGVKIAAKELAEEIGNSFKGATDIIADSVTHVLTGWQKILYYGKALLTEGELPWTKAAEDAAPGGIARGMTATPEQTKEARDLAYYREQKRLARAMAANEDDMAKKGAGDAQSMAYDMSVKYMQLSLGMTDRQTKIWELGLTNVNGQNDALIKQLQIQDQLLTVEEEKAKAAKEAAEAKQRENTRALDMLDKINAEIEAIQKGWTSGMREIMELNKGLVDPDTLQMLIDAQTDLDKLNQRKKDQEDAKSLAKRHASPMQKTIDELKDLQRLKDILSPADFAAIYKGIESDYVRGELDKGGGKRLAGAAEMGSAEAWRVLQDSISGKQRDEERQLLKQQVTHLNNIAVGINKLTDEGTDEGVEF